MSCGHPSNSSSIEPTANADHVPLMHSFWSYEISKRWAQQYNASSNPGQAPTQTQEALSVLLCGGLAGVATWVSIFPLGMSSHTAKSSNNNQSH